MSQFIVYNMLFYILIISYIILTFLLLIESNLTSQYEAILGLWNFQFS